MYIYDIVLNSSYVYIIVEKYCRAGQIKDLTQYTRTKAHVLFMPDNSLYDTDTN